MTKPKPKLTIEAFHESLKPPNNCRVAAFLAEMDADSRAVLEEAIALSKAEYPASQIITLLESAGYEPAGIPGVDAFSCHRTGRRPCRCRG